MKRTHFIAITDGLKWKTNERENHNHPISFKRKRRTRTELLGAWLQNENVFQKETQAQWA
jgi:hypothetical protein